jgi:hypothetical protein
MWRDRELQAARLAPSGTVGAIGEASMVDGRCSGAVRCALPEILGRSPLRDNFLIATLSSKSTSKLLQTKEGVPFESLHVTPLSEAAGLSRRNRRMIAL